MEPILKFKGYSINKMFYSKEPIEFKKEEFKDDKGFSLSVEQAISEDLTDAKLTVTIQLRDVKNEKYLIAEIESYFEFNEANSLEWAKKVLLVNGTAIVYPYIRSMVSMVTSLDTENAIILPTINTMALGDE